jgi:hypothetical protein
MTSESDAEAEAEADADEVVEDDGDDEEEVAGKVGGEASRSGMAAATAASTASACAWVGRGRLEGCDDWILSREDAVEKGEGACRDVTADFTDCDVGVGTCVAVVAVADEASAG